MACYLFLFLCVIQSFQSCQCNISMCRESFESPPNRVCADFCNDTNCKPYLMQAYKQLDETSSLKGCISNDFINATGIYQQFHILYADTEARSKIYLIITENPNEMVDNSSFDITVYNFVLWSTSPVVWFVSYQAKSSSHYNFTLSSGSVLKDYFSGTTVAAKMTKPQLKTRLGYWYSPNRIHYVICKDVFGQRLLAQCPLSSFLNITGIYYINITLPCRPSPGEKPTLCEFRPEGFAIGDGKLKAFARRSLILNKSCNNSRLTVENQMIYVVDVVNKNWTNIILLQIDGGSTLAADNKLTIILKSSQPVVWMPQTEKGDALRVNITFVVSSNSSINTTRLQFGNSKLHTKKISKDYTSEGYALMEEVENEFHVPVLSYGKFLGDPDTVRILLVENEPSKIPPDDDDYRIIALLIINGSKGAQLTVHCSLLKKYGLKFSELRVGNGSCDPSPDNIFNNVIFKDLQKCGLTRVSNKDFEIGLTIRNKEQNLTFLVNAKKSSIAVYQDCYKHKKISFPHVVTMKDLSTSYYAEVSLSSFTKYGFSSKLDHCYLTNHNGSMKHDLIFDSCLLDKNRSLSFYAPGPSYKFGFTFSMDPLLKKGHQGEVNLVCRLSRCFLADGIHPPSNILPQCPISSSTHCLHPRRIPAPDRFNEILQEEVFFLESGNSQPTTFMKLTTTRTFQQKNNFVYVILITILSLVVVILAVLLLILCQKFGGFDKKNLEKRPSSLNNSNNHTHVNFPPGNEEIALMREPMNDPSRGYDKECRSQSNKYQHCRNLFHILASRKRFKPSTQRINQPCSSGLISDNGMVKELPSNFSSSILIKPIGNGVAKPVCAKRESESLLTPSLTMPETNL